MSQRHLLIEIGIRFCCFVLFILGMVISIPLSQNIKLMSIPLLIFFMLGSMFPWEVLMDVASSHKTSMKKK